MIGDIDVQDIVDSDGTEEPGELRGEPVRLERVLVPPGELGAAVLGPGDNKRMESSECSDPVHRSDDTLSPPSSASRLLSSQCRDARCSPSSSDKSRMDASEERSVEPSLLTAGELSTESKSVA